MAWVYNRRTNRYLVCDEPPSVERPVEPPPPRRPAATWRVTPAWTAPQPSPRVVQLPPGGISIPVVMRDLLIQALERSNGIQAGAAALLRMSPRVFHTWVTKYGITTKRARLTPGRHGHGVITEEDVA